MAVAPLYSSIVQSSAASGMSESVKLPMAILQFHETEFPRARSIRQRVQIGCFLKYSTKIIYLSIPICITYIMGLMHNATTLYVLYPIWACALIYAYGGVITMTACDLSDNEDTLRYVWRIIPLLCWTVWLGLMVYFNTEHSVTLVIVVILFLFVASLNTIEKLTAFHKAAKSKGLPKVVDPIVRYMRIEGDGQPNEMLDPVSMTGYRYVVWGNPTKANGIITTENIWQSVGENFLANCAGTKHLRDVCLSYAFFRLILRRFAGFPLYESSEAKTRRFIQEGLLSMEPQRVERVFRIIEVELEFLFHFLYTKSHVCSSNTFACLGRACAILVFYAAVGYFFIANHITMRYAGHILAIVVTGLVIIILLSLEFCKFIMVSFSNRTIVLLLCTGLREAAGSNRRWLKELREVTVKWIWFLNDYLSRRDCFHFFFKPWQRQLGQYSFLESYGRVPILARKSFSKWLGDIMELPRAGQEGYFGVELSIQVKEAIVSSLLRILEINPESNEPVRLSRGTTTLGRLPPGRGEFLVLAREFETDAHAILAWHIATSKCEFLHAPTDDDPNFLVATQLSKYCAYLVAFAPELLPGHSYTTERLYDKAVEQAKEVLTGLDLRVGNHNWIGAGVDQDNVVVVRGIMLADGLLIPVVLPNPDLGWKFLADFWAEMLLYLAPSDNVNAHGEHLANGGEFITHLWALLTHAGVVCRNRHATI